MSECLERIEKHGNGVVDRLDLLDILAQYIDDQAVRISIEDAIRGLRTEVAEFAGAILEHLSEESNA